MYRRWLATSAMAAVFFSALLVSPASSITPITSWGTVIGTSEETYELVGDLNDNGVDPWAITISPGVRDVVINGNGFRLIGDGVSGSFEGGIRIDGSTERITDVRIENLGLRNLDSGVVGEGSICHLTVHGCDMAGFTDGRAVSVRTLLPTDVVRWIVVRNNRIREGRCLGVVFENAGNTAGAGAEMTSCSVISNTISDLLAPGATPEPLRGGVLALGGGDRIRIHDNVILGGLEMSGVLISSRDEPGESFEHVSIVGNLIGDRLGTDGTATDVSGIKCDRVHAAYPVLWNLQGNYLFFNQGFGIDNLVGSAPLTLDARRCWWGDDAGPAGPWGDGASGDLTVAPVLDLPGGLLLLPNLRLTNCSGWVPLVGLYNQDQGVPGLRGFDIDLSITSAEADLVDFERGGYLVQSGLGTQYYMTGAGDERTITGTILGGGPPLATGNGDLFRLLFSGIQENVPTGYDGEATALLLRDPDNAPIPVAGLHDSRMTVDCTPPDVTITGTIDCGIPTITVYAIDYDLDEVFLRIAPDCWRLLAQDECEDGFETTLTLAEFADLPDGIYDIQVCVTDDAGNETLETWSFERVTSPPPSVAGLTVTPDHNLISLEWTPSIYPVEIVRKAWSYPEYDDVMTSPGYPSDPGDGVLAVTLPPGSDSYVDVFDDMTRNAYFYTLFHRDEVCGYASIPDPGAQGVALSYWIGDFTASSGFGPPYDGYVSAVDLVLISGGFGTQNGDAGYDAQLDIGPTSTGYVNGIPLTDDIIDFEDVILFSIQYGVTAPPLPNLLLPLPAVTNGEPRLAIETFPGRESDLIDLRIRLEGNGDEVKGIRASIGLETKSLRFVEATLGEGLQDLEAPMFLGVTTEESGQIEIVATPLGQGRAFHGNGTVVEVTLRRMGEQTAGAASLLEAELRDLDNETIYFVQADQELAPPPESIVGSPRLLEAVPNPARGSTRIRFLLDRTERCELAIYDAGGRLVRRLLSDERALGLHGIDWDGRLENGRHAANGIYHCVLRTDRGTQSSRIAILH